MLRRRYWLYYALEFMSGARRQIFIVFAAFMMVETFGYAAKDITLLFLVNCLISIWVAPRVGRLIVRWGERPALIFEYIGLIGVFTAYAFVQTGWLAAGLYIVDHLFFALAIAIKSYFRKIADPSDIASTAGVSLTISHIAAVGLPPILGLVWVLGEQGRAPCSCSAWHRGRLVGAGPARAERSGAGQRDGAMDAVEEPRRGVTHPRRPGPVSFRAYVHIASNSLNTHSDGECSVAYEHRHRRRASGACHARDGGQDQA